MTVSQNFQKLLSLFVFIRCLYKKDFSLGHNSEVSKTHQGYSVPNLPLSVPLMFRIQFYVINPTAPTMDLSKGEKRLSWRDDLDWSSSHILGGGPRNLGWLCRWESKYHPWVIQKPNCSCKGKEKKSGLCRRLQKHNLKIKQGYKFDGYVHWWLMR